MSSRFVSVALVVLVFSGGFFGIQLEDNDGLSFVTELRLQTNPSDPDTDSDGLDDDVEVDIVSNPRYPDTDNDGLPDGEEFRGDTPVNTADTDNDELLDGEEVDIGTDPTVADTDVDGLSDGVEVQNEGVLENASPLRYDVFIEVDTVKSSFDRGAYRKVEDAYADAPVTNPDGSQGIDMHITLDQRNLDIDSTPSYSEYRQSRDTVFQRDGYGYRHVLIVDEIDGSSNNTVGKASEFGALVEAQPNQTITGGVVMHELGHVYNIRPSDYEGVDSTTVPEDEYPSAMNYAYIRDCISLREDTRTMSCETPYQYNDGEPFDDWDELTSNLNSIDDRCLTDETSFRCD